MSPKSIPSVLVALVLSAAFAGCSTPKKGPVPVPNPRTLSGEGREWWDVFSAEMQGDRKVLTKLGYLYRKYDVENPKTYSYWVLDVAQNQIGFMLPDFQAFLIKQPSTPNGKPESVPLGGTDLATGVKKILQVPGTVELVKVLPKPGAPAPLPAK